MQSMAGATPPSLLRTGDLPSESDTRAWSLLSKVPDVCLIAFSDDVKQPLIKFVFHFPLLQQVERDLNVETLPERETRYV
jgi:hypothetical protein